MDILHIDSSTDPRLDEYRSLTDTALRSIREPAGGLYIAESSKVIERAIRAGHSPRSVLVQERRLDGIRSIVAGFDVPVYVVPDDVAEAVTGFAVHRGAIASMHRPPLPSVAETLGEHVFDFVLRNKRQEWDAYRAQVTPFELKRFLQVL